jgi:colanic acid biosynthesis glycosyl transferase WcaI
VAEVTGRKTLQIGYEDFLDTFPEKQEILFTMKIVAVLIYWYPYEGPLMPIYGAVFEDLMKWGHDVTIISSFPHYRLGRRETWEEHRGKLFQVTDWKGAKLIRSYVYAPVFHRGNLGLIYRILNFISFNISSMLTSIFLTGNVDIIFAPSSPPLSNGVVAWIVSLFKRCPMVYSVQDMYPDIAEKTGLVRSRSVLAATKWIEKLVYAISDRVILLSEDMRKKVLRKGIPEEKTEVIPNFFDTGIVRPTSRENAFSREWGLSERFVAVYAGNAGIPHGAEVIIHAAELLQHLEQMILCFVGGGEYRPRLQKLAQLRGLKNVLFIEAPPYSRMNDVLSSASLSFVTYRKGLAEDSLPSKLIASMCCELPVVASIDEGSETARIIQSAQCGIVVPAEDASALSKAVTSLYRDEAMRSEMGKRGREYALRHFKREVMSSRYERTFQSLVRSDRRR